MLSFLAFSCLFLYKLLKVDVFDQFQQIGNQLFNIDLVDPIYAIEPYDELSAESKHKYLKLNDLVQW
jgi:hypothetical protein